MDEILQMSREINFNNLNYHSRGPGPSISFTELAGPMYTCNQLKNGDKTLSQVEEDQTKFRSELSQIPSEYYKSENELNATENVKNLYNSRQKMIDLLNDNSRVRSEAIYKAKQNDAK